jgi:uncharacterized protein
MQTLLAQVEQLVKIKFTDQEGSHDWFHIDRVRKNALLIQQSEGGDALVVELAALLHDYSDHKYNGGDFDKGVQEVTALLLDLNSSEELASKVAQIVGVVSYKGAGVADQVTNLEGKIVRDADRLDAIGAIGIARAFSYGGSKGRALYDDAISPTMHHTKEAYAQDKGHQSLLRKVVVTQRPHGNTYCATNCSAKTYFYGRFLSAIYAGVESRKSGYLFKNSVVFFSISFCRRCASLLSGYSI